MRKRISTNAPLTMMELFEAIFKQKKGKSLGPDGLPAEYYQKLENILSNNLNHFLVS